MDIQIDDKLKTAIKGKLDTMKILTPILTIGVYFMMFCSELGKVIMYKLPMDLINVDIADGIEWLLILMVAIAIYMFFPILIYIIIKPLIKKYKVKAEGNARWRKINAFIDMLVFIIGFVLFILDHELVLTVLIFYVLFDMLKGVFKIVINNTKYSLEDVCIKVIIIVVISLYGVILIEVNNDMHTTFLYNSRNAIVLKTYKDKYVATYYNEKERKIEKGYFLIEPSNSNIAFVQENAKIIVGNNN